LELSVEEEEEVAKLQIVLGDALLDASIKKEKAISKQDNKRRYLFCVSIDIGWNNCISRESYHLNSAGQPPYHHWG
jgi:hypothetical protein